MNLGEEERGDNSSRTASGAETEGRSLPAGAGAEGGAAACASAPPLPPKVLIIEGLDQLGMKVDWYAEAIMGRGINGPPDIIGRQLWWVVAALPPPHSPSLCAL